MTVSLEGDSTDELERDFLFGHTAQRKKREDCLTIKCPLLHTAVTNSLWIPSIVKYSNTDFPQLIQLYEQYYNHNFKTSV